MMIHQPVDAGVPTFVPKVSWLYRLRRVRLLSSLNLRGEAVNLWTPGQ